MTSTPSTPWRIQFAEPSGYGRAVGGLVIVAVLITFILSNRDTTEVSFLFISADGVPLWVALTIAAALGVAVGFILGRRKHRGR